MQGSSRGALAASQQALEAAKVDEGAVSLDAFHCAIDNLTFAQVIDHIRWLLIAHWVKTDVPAAPAKIDVPAATPAPAAAPTAEKKDAGKPEPKKN